MNLLLAVIDDLYRFALESTFRLVGSEQRETLPLFSFLPTIPSPTEEQEIPQPSGSSSDQLLPVETKTFKTVEEVLKKKSPADLPDIITMGPAQNTVMYAYRTSVPIFQNPTSEFDTIAGSVSYGSMIMVLEDKGKFVRISSNGLSGWARKEDLADRAAYVYPDFVIGEENGADDPNTIRVRAILGDEFSGGLIEYPLQAGEYVLYRLYRKGLHIEWPSTRPRVPGMWHEILKGVVGIHMSVSPKTGSVMEYMLSEEVGHVAFVEAVFPDETITISEVNFPHGGIYNERVLTRDEWRELRPVFIQVA